MFLPKGWNARDLQETIEEALGYSLGGLDWKDLGPLMCQYLSKLDIQVAIYLPQEQVIAPEFLTKQFLLGK